MLHVLHCLLPAAPAAGVPSRPPACCSQPPPAPDQAHTPAVNLLSPSPPRLQGHRDARDAGPLRPVRPPPPAAHHQAVGRAEGGPGLQHCGAAAASAVCVCCCATCTSAARALHDQAANSPRPAPCVLPLPVLSRRRAWCSPPSRCQTPTSCCWTSPPTTWTCRWGAMLQSHLQAS